MGQNTKYIYIDIYGVLLKKGREGLGSIVVSWLPWEEKTLFIYKVYFWKSGEDLGSREVTVILWIYKVYFWKGREGLGSREVTVISVAFPSSIHIYIKFNCTFFG